MDDRYIVGMLICVGMAFIAGIPIAHYWLIGRHVRLAHYWLIGRHVRRDDTDE